MANINFPEVKDRDPNADVDMEILNDTLEYIRPAVQADCGDIKLASVENGVVNIEMLGACQIVYLHPFFVLLVSIETSGHKHFQLLLMCHSLLINMLQK